MQIRGSHSKKSLQVLATSFSRHLIKKLLHLLKLYEKACHVSLSYITSFPSLAITVPSSICPSIVRIRQTRFFFGLYFSDLQVNVSKKKGDGDILKDLMKTAGTAKVREALGDYLKALKTGKEGILVNQRVPFPFTQIMLCTVVWIPRSGQRPRFQR